LAWWQGYTLVLKVDFVGHNFMKYFKMIIYAFFFYFERIIYTKLKMGISTLNRRREFPPYTSYTPSAFTDKYSSPFHLKSASFSSTTHSPTHKLPSLPLAICSQPSPPSLLFLQLHPSYSSSLLGAESPRVSFSQCISRYVP